MSATFTWAVVSMACYPQAESETDVVFNVSWTCRAVQDTYQAATSGAANVTYEAGTPFTPYADLTEAQVLGWVYTAVNKAGVESSLQAQIDEQIDPPIITPPLPWATPAA